MWRRALPAAILAAAALASPAGAQDATPAPVAARPLAVSPQLQRALDALAADHDRFVDEIVRLTEIPAPPFGEGPRGQAFRAMLADAGLTDVAVDEVGNVTALRRGSGRAGGPVIVVSAHLDTVFPEGTDVTVRRQGTRLAAPGIGDDSRGLAALLAYARALESAGVRTRRDILFVGTVGEEGRGDLRGARHLVERGPYRRRIAGFFSIDGLAPARIVAGGVGSKRYRMTFRGPGGHSYGAFGIVNPAAALGRAISDIYALPVPRSPRTTYSVSVLGGGTSVNAIPDAVFADVDLRSESGEALDRLDRAVRDIARQAADVENASRSTQAGRVTVEMEPIGDRPAGRTPEDAAIVRLSAAAAARAGYTPTIEASSTDANAAMSRGIPAVTLGSGGTGGRAHAPDEWIDVAREESVRGLGVGLMALVAVADAR